MTTVTSTSGGRLSRWVPPLLVLALIASIVGVGFLAGANSDESATRTTIAEPIRSSVLLCPEPERAEIWAFASRSWHSRPAGQEGDGEAGLRTLRARNRQAPT